MLRSWRAVFARFRALLRSDAAGVRAGFFALLLSSGGDLLAGLTLGSITGTLEALPGLLVLVPAAIGMRGNVFGALGSRLGTAVHTGTFRMSARRDTVVGQNLAASLSMSLSVSFVLAVLAKVDLGGVRPGEHDLGRRLRRDLGGRRLPVVDRRDGDHGGGGAARGPPRLGPRQRDVADRDRGGRHGHAARAVPRDLPRRHPVADDHRRRSCARSSALVALVASLRSRVPDPAPHRPRVAARARARRHHRRRRRPHDREALLVVPRVPRAARARARRSSRTPARSAAS